MDVVEREREGVVVVVGAAEASSPNLPLADTIYAAVVGGWTASIAAPAASTLSPRCQAAAGCALEGVRRCGQGETAMVMLHSVDSARIEPLLRLYLSLEWDSA